MTTRQAIDLTGAAPSVLPKQGEVCSLQGRYCLLASALALSFTLAMMAESGRWSAAETGGLIDDVDGVGHVARLPVFHGSIEGRLCGLDSCLKLGQLRFLLRKSLAGHVDGLLAEDMGLRAVLKNAVKVGNLGLLSFEGGGNLPQMAPFRRHFCLQRAFLRRQLLQGIQGLRLRCLGRARRGHALKT